MHYSGANSYLFVNDTEIIKFKAKDSQIVATPLCLGNISKDVFVNNVKNYIDMFMILVLLMMVLQLMIY